MSVSDVACLKSETIQMFRLSPFPEVAPLGSHSSRKTRGPKAIADEGMAWIFWLACSGEVGIC